MVGGSDITVRSAPRTRRTGYFSEITPLSSMGKEVAMKAEVGGQGANSYLRYGDLNTAIDLKRFIPRLRPSVRAGV